MKEQDLIAEVKQFVETSESADSEERSLFSDDLKFVFNEDGQWSEKDKKSRAGRPCYTFNKLIGAVNQVVGDQRQARPQIKVRGVDDRSDPELAEVYGGMIRNIEACSDAESIYDTAFKYAVAGGWGAWRVMPEYSSPESFTQDIKLKMIWNPLTVYWDPTDQTPCKREQGQCVVATRISIDRYKALYGDKNYKNVEVSRDNRGWVDDKQVRIAEYWKKIWEDKEIALLSDGRVVDYDKDLEAELKSIGNEVPTIVKKRKTKVCKIRWWKVDGAQTLEGPITYDWKYIPVVKLPGRYINIEGEQKTQSLIRHSKDAQKVYNYDRTTMTETVANTPRAPYLVTPDMIKGLEKQWAAANSANRPYLAYNPDPMATGAGGVPKREAPPDVPAALIALAQQDNEDIKATTGYFDASLGREADKQESGRLMIERSRRGDLGSYEFVDNLSKAIKFTGEILVDMIPKVYDSERTVRILGLDGEEDYVKVNAYDEARKKKMNLGDAQYDVSVNIGPAYATARQEALSTLLEAAGVMPIVAETSPDLVLKNLDVPGSDELVKRIRRQLILSGKIEPNEDEMEELPPPQPDPVKDALVATEQAKAKSLQAKAVKDMSDAQKAAQMTRGELEKMLADIVGTQLDNALKRKELAAPLGEVTTRVSD